MNPLVSIIMPVHNTESYVGRAITSILRQSFKDFELIVVDDGSTDSTRSVVRKFADPRVCLVCSRKNFGANHARNRGLDLARGELYACMDSDDESLPNRLHSQVRFLSENANIGILGGSIIWKKLPNGHFATKRYPLSHLSCLRRLSTSPCFCHPTIMIRRKAVPVDIRYNESFQTTGDYKLYVDLCQHTEFANLKETLLIYHRHPNSITLTKGAEKKINRERVHREYLSQVLGDDLVNRFHNEVLWLAKPESAMTMERLIEFYKCLDKKQSYILGQLFRRSIRQGIDRVEYGTGTRASDRLILTFLRYKLKRLVL